MHQSSLMQDQLTLWKESLPESRKREPASKAGKQSGLSCLGPSDSSGCQSDISQCLASSLRAAASARTCLKCKSSDSIYLNLVVIWAQGLKAIKQAAAAQFKLAVWRLWIPGQQGSSISVHFVGCVWPLPPSNGHKHLSRLHFWTTDNLWQGLYQQRLLAVSPF